MDEQIKRASASLPLDPETETGMFILTNNPMYFFFVSGVIGERGNQGAIYSFPGTEFREPSVTYKRKDVYTIDVQSDNGSLTDLDSALFSKESAMQPGQIVRLSNAVVEVLEVKNGLPSRAQFKFKIPLDDPGFLWFRWENGTYVPFTPPDVGETVTIESSPFPRG